MYEVGSKSQTAIFEYLIIQEFQMLERFYTPKKYNFSQIYFVFYLSLQPIYSNVLCTIISDAIIYLYSIINYHLLAQNLSQSVCFPVLYFPCRLCLTNPIGFVSSQHLFGAVILIETVSKLYIRYLSFFPAPSFSSSINFV